MTLENSDPAPNLKSSVPGQTEQIARTAPLTVSVSGGARLHFGFADPSGTLGRRFGSIGLAIEQPQYKLRFRRLEPDMAAQPTGADETLRRLNGFVAQVIAHYGYDFNVGIEVDSTLASHAGLGSGTQLALAAGVASSLLAGKPLSCYKIAGLLGRGMRSSIGAAAFDHGGFIVDGGRAQGDAMAPVIVSQPFPQDWAIILIIDDAHSGLSADTEVAAFDDLPDFQSAASGEICRLLMLQVIPAILAHDIQPFAAGISRIQQITGDYFAAHQGGSRFTSQRVGDVLRWFQANGSCGEGQSSWGPTGYTFCDSLSEARKLVDQARSHDRGLEFLITRGRNSGVSIETA